MRNYYLIIYFIFLLFIQAQITEAKVFTSTVCPWPGGEYSKLFEIHLKKEGLDVETKFFSTVPDWVKACSSGRFDFTLMWFGNGLSSFWGENNPGQVAISPVFHDYGSTAIIARKGFSTGDITLGDAKTIGVEFRSLVNYGMLFSLFNSEKLNFSQLVDKGIVELSNEDLISNLQVGRLKVITATGNDVKKLTNMGYQVLTSSRQHVDLTTGLIWMPEAIYYQTDKEVLNKIIRASVFAARDMQTLRYEELKKIIMSDPGFAGIPIMAHSYASRENFEKFRNNVVWYTPSLAKERAIQFPMIFKKMISLQKETGREITASYEQIIKFDDFFKTIDNIQKSREEITPATIIKP